MNFALTPASNLIGKWYFATKIDVCKIIKSLISMTILMRQGNKKLNNFNWCFLVISLCWHGIPRPSDAQCLVQLTFCLATVGHQLVATSQYSGGPAAAALAALGRQQSA